MCKHIYLNANHYMQSCIQNSKWKNPQENNFENKYLASTKIERYVWDEKRDIGPNEEEVDRYHLIKFNFSWVLFEPVSDVQHEADKLPHGYAIDLWTYDKLLPLGY